MGRAGAGGGRSHSSGGHSSSRSSGGHRVSSHRAGSSSGRSSWSSFSSSYRGSRSYSSGPVYRGSRSYSSGPVYRGYSYQQYGGGYGSGAGMAAAVVFAIIAIICLMAVYSSVAGGQSVSSTIERHSLDTGNAYINDCIIDEIGWFDNITKTEGRLKSFWEETGVQPFIILKAYDSSLVSDSAKEEWAREYYDRSFGTENVFLYVYFAEADVDEDVGYMAYVNGKQTSAVMDAEAVSIFWNYVNRYWYSDMSTDDMFAKIFDGTADTIMRVSTTGKDIVKWLLILGVAVAMGAAVIIIIILKHKRSREKAEEDARILNTPVDAIALDHLEDKYLK